eukprot:scaffold34596_cov222-Amphora_coffeaeformis.AAC.16
MKKQKNILPNARITTQSISHQPNANKTLESRAKKKKKQRAELKALYANEGASNVNHAIANLPVYTNKRERAQRRGFSVSDDMVLTKLARQPHLLAAWVTDCMINKVEGTMVLGVKMDETESLASCMIESKQSGKDLMESGARSDYDPNKAPMISTGLRFSNRAFKKHTCCLLYKDFSCDDEDTIAQVIFAGNELQKAIQKLHATGITFRKNPDIANDFIHHGTRPRQDGGTKPCFGNYPGTKHSGNFIGDS